MPPDLERVARSAIKALKEAFKPSRLNHIDIYGCRQFVYGLAFAMTSYRLETQRMSFRITALFLLLLTNFAKAQETELSANWKAEFFRGLLIQQFKDDSRFEVFEDDQGVLIKNRSKKSKNPDDPEELKRIENLQATINFGIAEGWTAFPMSSYGQHADEPNASYVTGATTAQLQFAIRPPYLPLKKLLIGYEGNFVQGLSYNRLPLSEKDGINYSQVSGVAIGDFVSAEWDVLFIPKMKAMISAGAFQGWNRTSRDVQYGEHEEYGSLKRGLQFRFRGLVKEKGAGVWSYYAQARFYSNRMASVVFGVSIGVGTRVHVKKKIEK